GPHVPSLQPMLRQVARQSDRVQFFDVVHSFGSGYAVTNRGVSLPGSIYHALRICSSVPSGAVNGPSTANRVPCRVFPVSTTSFSFICRRSASLNRCQRATVKPKRRKNAALLPPAGCAGLSR